MTTDTTLTQEEIEACRDAFLAFDKDRSGTIDNWELRQVLEAMGQKPTEEELFQMISEVDDNMSGAIDFKEFLKVIEKQKARAAQFDDESDTLDAFVACGGGADKSGHVEKDTLIGIIKDSFGLTIDIVGLIEQVDTDGSGEIEYDEFKATIAVEGCAHGDLDSIYASVVRTERERGVSVDLLLICGDFQAVRNEEDLSCMACPDKYLSMNSFYKYYSGECAAPYLTVFIGGNHEASNHLQELPLGGWVAPRIYYMGYAGVVRFRGLRIGGLTGIYKPEDFTRPHHEAPPYNPRSMRSVYHVREADVYRLLQLRQPLDVFLSHDWPRGIAHHGDTATLLRRKKFLEREVNTNTLGNPAGELLLRALKPTFWFAAHLHTKFAAVVRHDEGPPTRFLALDKCLPKRHFLQLFSVAVPNPEAPATLAADPEWLCIAAKTGDVGVVAREETAPNARLDPSADLARTAVSIARPEACSDAERESMHARLREAAAAQGEEVKGEVPIPLSLFARTLSPFTPPYEGWRPRRIRQPPQRGNPQTDYWLGLLGLPHVGTIPATAGHGAMASAHSEAAAQDENEIDLELDESAAGAGAVPTGASSAHGGSGSVPAAAADDDNEIDLDGADAAVPTNAAAGDDNEIDI